MILIIFLNDLKNKIENEINKINQLYEKAIKDVTNSYFIQQEKLIKEGNDLKEKLQNEVTGFGGQLENFLSKSNTIFSYFKSPLYRKK